VKETPELRSRIMRAVKSGDTTPELAVRSLAHRMGYRFRLRLKDLPGKPDLVFPRMRKAIFVHGCFWHGHDCARGARVPKRNRDYWVKKIKRNKERDNAARQALRRAGWRVAVVWECALRKDSNISSELRNFLREPARRKR
jgi:DNA mismatch endonuclease (patch repair protein)